MPGELSPARYISRSLEQNLFFLNIMKEHSILIEASFSGKDVSLAEEANTFKNQFEELLARVLPMADGHVSPAALKSGEVGTDVTEYLEQMTQNFTGININTAIARAAMQLKPGIGDTAMESEVSELNNRAIALCKSIIAFKSMLINDKKHGVIFTAMFYSELEHMQNEAHHYVSELEALQQRQNPYTKKAIISEKIFWNKQMADHAKYIEHLLEPSENVGIIRARGFTSKFHKLKARAEAAQYKGILNKRLRILLLDEMSAVESLTRLKSSIVNAYQECKANALLLPIWPDHVMREAHHFQREMRYYYDMNG